MTDPMTPGPDFWDPTFDISYDADGTIHMRHTEELPSYQPTLADYLDKWADATPDQSWLVQRDDQGDWRHISYGGARDTARRLGASLLALGLGPERPLLILSGNSLEHAMLGAACFYVGIPYAPVSPAYSLVSKDHSKLRDIAVLLKPGAIYAEDGAAFAPACAAIAAPDQTVINLRTPQPGAVAFDALPKGDPATAEEARQGLTEATVVKYLFTSGSTGSPKAVINTNGMICANQAMVRDCYRFATHTPPVVLDWAPWNHTAAGNKVSYFVMTNGGTYYIDEGKPTPDKIGQTVQNLRDIACTWYFNVPIGWDLLVEELERDEALARRFFSRLSMMFYAGAGITQQTGDRLRALARKITGREMLIATSLGATETGPFGLCCTDLDASPANLGLPSRGLRMKLVPTGDKLELRLKGPSITPGYYGDPVKTAEAFDEDGYYKMGDALRPADPNDLTKGFLFNGRIAENFKLSTGTWVTVGALRAAFVDAMGGLIRDAVIVGENQREVGALLLLSSRAQALPDQERTKALKAQLSEAASKATGSSNRVTRAAILRSEPSFDRGEVTEKGSLNQRALRANYDSLIMDLYSETTDVLTV